MQLSAQVRLHLIWVVSLSLVLTSPRGVDPQKWPQAFPLLLSPLSLVAFLLARSRAYFPALESGSWTCDVPWPKAHQKIGYCWREVLVYSGLAPSDSPWAPSNCHCALSSCPVGGISVTADTGFSASPLNRSPHAVCLCWKHCNTVFSLTVEQNQTPSPAPKTLTLGPHPASSKSSPLLCLKSPFLQPGFLLSPPPWVFPLPAPRTFTTSMPSSSLQIQSYHYLPSTTETFLPHEVFPKYSSLTHSFIQTHEHTMEKDSFSPCSGGAESPREPRAHSIRLTLGTHVLVFHLSISHICIHP